MSVFLPFTYKWSVCRVGLRRTCIGPFLPKMYVINVINNKMKDDHMKGNAPTTHDTPNIGEKIYSCNTCSKNLIERKRLNMKTLM